MSASPPPPAAPESFALAYAGLGDPAEGLSRGGPAGAAPGATGRIRAWQNGPCGGSVSLAKAATLAMRHEIAAARPAGGAARSPADDPKYGALREVERALWPPEPEEIPPPVGVGSPPELRRALGPGTPGGRMGRLEAIFSRSPVRGAILSLSHPERFPRVEEIRAARLAFGRRGPKHYMELRPGTRSRVPPTPSSSSCDRRRADTASRALEERGRADVRAGSRRGQGWPFLVARAVGPGLDWPGIRDNKDGWMLDLACT